MTGVCPRSGEGASIALDALAFPITRKTDGIIQQKLQSNKRSVHQARLF